MHRTWNHRFCGLAALLWIVLVVGCNRPPGQLADAAVTPDAEVDAAVIPPPLRTLGRRGLFGQTPVQNRFFDPTFAQIDGVAWSPFHATAYEVCPVTRLHLQTPTGQPAIRLEPPAGQVNGQVVGMAKGAPGPMEVSVWLGRFLGTNVAGLSVTLYGMFLGNTGGVNLEADPDVPPVILDGVSWVQFRAYLAEGPASWAYLRINNQEISPLLISGPVFMQVSAQTRRVSALAPAVVRPLLPAERASWQDWKRRLQERFGGAPRPFSL